MSPYISLCYLKIYQLQGMEQTDLKKIFHNSIDQFYNNHKKIKRYKFIKPGMRANQSSNSSGKSENLDLEWKASSISTELYSLDK